MGFLAPAFLLGLAAIALPLWLHRLETESADRRPFSSAMLLERAEQRVHVRRRLRYFALLALRILLLALIAIAFAKPFLATPAEPAAIAASGSHLVVVDTSASMQRGSAADSSRSLANQALDDVPAGALVQVFAAASGLVPVTEPLIDRGTHRDAIRALEPVPARLDFGAAMARLDRVASTLPAPVTVHLVSDFQRSAMPARFADLAVPRVARLVTHRVEPAPAGNVGITALRENPDGVEVDLAGRGPAEVELSLNGSVVGRRTRAAGGPATIRFDAVGGDSGDNRLVARLAGTDDYAWDDRRYRVVERLEPEPVPVITSDEQGLPFVYLSTALAAGQATGFEARALPANDFDPRVLSRYRFAIVDDIGIIEAALEPALVAWVEAGGRLLAFAGQRAGGVDRLPVTAHRVAPAATRARATPLLSVGRYDASHPVLRETEGWNAVQFTSVLPVEARTGDDVVAVLEDDAPLIVESALGGGRVLLVTGGLDNRGNDLPVRPVFVGFVLATARFMSGTSGLAKSYTTGESLAAGAAVGQVLDPAGNEMLSLGAASDARRIALNDPGFYEVYTPDTDYLVAANVDRREADFEVVDAGVLADWTALYGAAAGSDSAGIAAVLPRQAIDLWPLALLLLVASVIGESLVANSLLGTGPGPGRGETA